MQQTRTWMKVAAGLTATSLAAGALAHRWRRRWSFAGRVVVITGGSRGLGLVLARQLGDEGARLAILARDEAELRRAGQDLADHAGEVVALVCDLRDERQVTDAINRIADRYGRLDAIINNAGVIQVGPLECMTKSDFEETMAVHFWGALYTCTAALPHMRKQGAGRIVNISSIGGKVAIPHLVPYCASKFALAGMSQGMATELAKENILVTTVFPGLMRTGSPVNATMKGRHQEEFAWFAIADSLPILTTSAERAARRIIRACRYGEPQVVISIPARILALSAALFPRLTTGGLRLVARLLPSCTAQQGAEARLGHESQSAWAPSILTHLSDRAATRNNEMRGNGRH